MPKIPNWSQDGVGRGKKFVGHPAEVEKSWVYDKGNAALGVVDLDTKTNGDTQGYVVRLQLLSEDGYLQQAEFLRDFPRKDEAIDYAINWMRNNQTRDQVIHGN